MPQRDFCFALAIPTYPLPPYSSLLRSMSAEQTLHFGFYIHIVTCYGKEKKNNHKKLNFSKKNVLEIFWKGFFLKICINSLNGFWENRFYGRTTHACATALALLTRSIRVKNMSRPHNISVTNSLKLKGNTTACLRINSLKRSGTLIT